MEIGEINKGAVVLILVLLLGAGGYVWHSQMYKPAVADRTAAATEVATAQTTLNAAKQELAAAQAQFEAAKSEGNKLDDSVARVAKARTAIPEKRLIDDAAIVLMDMAERSGVNTSFKAEGSNDFAAAADASALQGATTIDLSFKAAGTYSEMMQFMSLVEGTVDRKGSKLHTRGRLFNVVQLKIGEDEDTSGGGGGGFGAEVSPGGASNDGLVVGKNDIVFTVVVRMYTSSTGNSQGVGNSLPDDPAAAGVDASADPSANAGAGGGVEGGVDPAAAGGAADPNAAAAGAPQPEAAGAVS